jgi:hypothetical protein
MLAAKISDKFQVGVGAALNLSDVSSLVELKNDRRSLIEFLREIIYPLRPTGGILEIPSYPWREIFTTNYDNLIEKSYAISATLYVSISANYEFDKERDGYETIFKLHGTIEKDKIDGELSSIIITNQDYVEAQAYREDMYDRLMMAGSANTLLIIGHSLADPDLNVIIDEATRRRTRSGSIGRVYVLAYERDDDRALLLEQRGLRVAFGGLDEFATAMADHGGGKKAVNPFAGSGVLSAVPGLPGVAVDVAHARSIEHRGPERMFYGSPATYPDIEAGFTFQRDIGLALANILTTEPIPFVRISGVAGVGKTTAVRQALADLSRHGLQCFEHMSDRALPSGKWIDAARRAEADGNALVLFVDDAHKYIQEIAAIVEVTSQQAVPSLRLVACTSKSHWNVRTKPEILYSAGRELTLSQLSVNEVERLLDLFQMKPEISRLVEREFAGFNRQENDVGWSIDAGQTFLYALEI